jgi:acetyl-CoA acetyltransferase
MNRPVVSVSGVGMTTLARRDLPVEELARQAALAALADADLLPSEVGLVVLGNAAGGRLCDQGCIRGQTWLRDVGLQGAPIVNVDNSCAGGSSALRLGHLAALGGESPVLVIGVEKMWTGSRAQTLAGVEDGLPAAERVAMHAELDNPAGSVLMGLNASWLERQIIERGTTLVEVAATAAKARRCAARNPLAQWQSEVSVEEVLASAPVAGQLTRLMCSSFTDGAAAAVLQAGALPGAPRVLASVARSGNGDLDYHDRLAETAEATWKAAGVGPDDIDVVELHDATSAEELYALESLGFFAPGQAGRATAAGQTDAGGSAVCVNPSGGLVGRGHPLGATGLCQLAELTLHLRGQAGHRQVEGARLALSVNTGGIIGGDAGFVGMHVLEAS